MLSFSVFAYNLFIRLYSLALTLAAPFHRKAKAWKEGRKNFPSIHLSAANRVWVHCASLGEFEQARPLIEKIKKEKPSHQIILSFFSPSGYEVRKNYKGADAVVYLPLDTHKNAIKFIDEVQPNLVIFVKYEFWFNLLNEIRLRKIPAILISSTFRKDQIFFTWYGGLHRSMLNCFAQIFVQNTISKDLLNGIQVKSAIAPDTRFDRVNEIAKQKVTFPLLEKFKNGRPILIAGSTWPADEDLIVECIKNQIPKDYKYIIAPHEISGNRLQRLLQRTGANTKLYSQLTGENAELTNVIIIDNYGMLASAYSYGNIAYVGGGFDASVHNILEAAVYAQPVMFGPNYNKSIEAKDLIASGGGFTISTFPELQQILLSFTSGSTNSLQTAAQKAATYVSNHVGGTEQIYSYLIHQEYI